MTAPTNLPLHDDDPRLTAYALGELAPDERAAVEAYLATSASARRFVEETRTAAAQLEREFAALPSAGSLEPAQREQVLARVAAVPAASAPRAEGRVLRLTTWPSGIAAAAAALVVGVTFSQRHEIGRWWTRVETDVARGASTTGRPGAAIQPRSRRFGIGRGDEAGLDRAAPREAAKYASAAAAVPKELTESDLALAWELLERRLADEEKDRSEAAAESGPVGGTAPPPAPKAPAPPAESKPRSLEERIGATGPGASPAKLPEKPRDSLGIGAQGGLGGSMGSGTYYDFGTSAGPGSARTDGIGRDAEKSPPTGAGAHALGAEGRTRRDALDAKSKNPGLHGGSGGKGGGHGRELPGRPRVPEVPSAQSAAPGALPPPVAPPPADGRVVAGSEISVLLAETASAQPADAGKVVAEWKETFRLLQEANVPPSTALVSMIPAGDRTTGPKLLRVIVDAERQGVHLDADLRRAIEVRVRDVERLGGKDSPENYAELRDNDFTKVADAPLSTFGTDVDTASYSNVRRFLRNGQLPPPGAVRIEEMLNYFPYQYAPPASEAGDGDAFAVHADVAGCPWNTANRLVRIALKGREVDFAKRPAANLVFLIDVSGSMRPENKLPLLLQSMKLLVEKLDEGDKVSVVVYAGASGLALAPTTGDRKADILAALDRLQAGGSTNGAAGIELAYQTAAEQFIPGGINRVILATDGDFNVGISDESSLVRLIEEKAKSKVFLSVLGFGEGNLQDAKMEKLADKGNGNYAYVDSLREGRKVLVEQAAGTLMTIAKDVKIQIEFNPLRVASYRLIGYENRVMAAQDFADDRKDAGDVGAGHCVTALYEIVPAGTTTGAATEPLRYQTPPAPAPTANSGELLNVKLRWKLPEGDVSTLRERPLTDSGASYAASSPDFKFAASVAAFGMLLRNSPHRGNATFDAVLELGGEGLSFDPDGHRAEFLDLVRAAKALAGR